MKKAPTRKEHSILDFLDETLKNLPEDAERERVIKSLDAIIGYFQDLRDRIRSLTPDYQQKEVLSAIDTVREFLLRAKNNPPLAAALGLHYQKAVTYRKPAREISQVEGKKIFNELKELTTEQILQKLLDYKKVSMAELRALATHLDIKEPEKMSRQDLVDKIVKIGFANIRGYEMLRSKE
jgi:hypothetical protein